MDQEEETPIGAAGEESGGRVSRRAVLRLGVGGLAAGACGGAAYCYFRSRIAAATAAEIFPGDAPRGRLWRQWQDRGWVKEARHWLALGENIQCKLCPNECLLAPEDRGRCRNRVHKEGKLYTLAYGNACAVSHRPDREEATVPFPSRHGRLFLCRHRLRLPLLELPELGHFPAQAGGDEGPSRRSRSASRRATCPASTAGTWSGGACFPTTSSP